MPVFVMLTRLSPELLSSPRTMEDQEACEAGVAAEIANDEMYDRLLGATQRPDILTVLRTLQEASQQRHLAAFQHCAQHSAGGGDGRGAGRHMGGRGRS